ncbi:hypothetical protein PanWU01x14_315290 [Parasponia andersonii]|uniref:Uncharacterized protein n=1 Tax=Parasponia andersonii TaxID=3476 RepID=A0A2P5ANR0_PARAD|nr:hypothetical protein PanWU01x14_315290 [Parasponia andersonii]
MATMTVAEHCDSLFLKRRGESILEFLVLPKKKNAGFARPAALFFSAGPHRAAPIHSGQPRPVGLFAKPSSTHRVSSLH